MKKLFFILTTTITYVLSSCTSSPTTTAGISTSSNDTTSATLPYTAAYSSKWEIGKQSTLPVVMDSYKAWESGDMNAFAKTYASNDTINLPDGSSLRGMRDSIMAPIKKFRDSLSSVKLNMDAWTPVHSIDRNEDWVLVWYTEVDTYKTGKVDSTYFEDDNRVNKDGKIDFYESHMRHLKK